MSTNDIAAKCRELRELQALIDEAQAEADAIKDALKAAMGDAIKDALKAAMGDAEELRAGEYKVTWKTVKAVKLDVSALKTALPDVAARFSRESVTRRFCVA